MRLMISFDDCLLSLVKEWAILFEDYVSSQWFLTSHAFYEVVIISARA